MKEKIIAPVITFLLISALGLAGTTYNKSSDNEKDIKQLKLAVLNVKKNKSLLCLMALENEKLKKQTVEKICVGN